MVLWVENLADQDALEQRVAVFSQPFNSMGHTTSCIDPTQRRYGVTVRYGF